MSTAARTAARARRRTGVVGVGYEGKTVEEFLSELICDGVRVVVDARITPRCTRRGFSRHGLAEALRSRGIYYVHFEALGNPEANQGGFRAGGEAAEAAARYYRGRLATPRARHVIDDIVAVSRRRRVAVMTAEADADTCHRATLLAEIQRCAGEVPDIDAVLAEFEPPEAAARARSAEPEDRRTPVERDIDALLAEFGD